MPFKKGHKRFGGTKKGTKQKRTLEWERFGKELLEHGVSRAIRIMEKSGDKQFMFYFEKYLEYFKPKLARTEMIHEGDLNINHVSKQTKFEIKTK